MDDKKIIKKAKSILSSYSDKENTYYQELKKSINEYESVDMFDKVTKDLYLDHINNLNSYLVQDKYSGAFVMFILSFIFCVIGLSFFTYSKYSDVSKALNENVVLSSDKVKLSVEYINLNNFNALTSSELDNYLELEPLTLKIIANDDGEKLYTVKYNVYLLEDNDSILENNLISRDAFIYSINTEKPRLLNAQYYDNNEILVYSGEIYGNNYELVDFRMWIDDQKYNDNINKLYKFKFKVEGYVS